MKTAKKSLLVVAFLAIIPVCARVSSAEVGTELVVGEFSYTYGDNETLTQAKEVCRKNAVRRAAEAAMVYISSKTRVNAGVLQSSDIFSLSEGCLTDLQTLQEAVNGREVYCRVQANVDVSSFEKRLEEVIEGYRIEPEKKVMISFYEANIDADAGYGADDFSKPAPDAYIEVKDKNGNRVFYSGECFLNKRKYLTLMTNRNNYNPDFKGVSFVYTFEKDDYLLIYFMDWDGIEGFMGSKKSDDDIIGQPFRLSCGYPLGKKLLEGKGWRVKMEVLEAR